MKICKKHLPDPMLLGAMLLVTTISLIAGYTGPGPNMFWKDYWSEHRFLLSLFFMGYGYLALGILTLFAYIISKYEFWREKQTC